MAKLAPAAFCEDSKKVNAPCLNPGEIRGTCWSIALIFCTWTCSCLGVPLHLRREHYIVSAALLWTAYKPLDPKLSVHVFSMSSSL